MLGGVENFNTIGLNVGGGRIGLERRGDPQAPQPFKRNRTLNHLFSVAQERAPKITDIEQIHIMLDIDDGIGHGLNGLGGLASKTFGNHRMKNGISKVLEANARGVGGEVFKIKGTIMPGQMLVQKIAVGKAFEH